jgi:CBS domain-containing protein
MTPRNLGDGVFEEAPLLAIDDSIESAVRRLLDSGYPALPVVDHGLRLAGVFGEREFIGALFPGYVTQLGYAGFVPQELEEALEKRQSCRVEPVGRYLYIEHVDVGTDFSDTQVAEIFLHHRVLIVPVTDAGHVVGIITRSAFFRALAQRFLEGG